MEQIKQTILNKVIRPRPLHSYKGNYGPLSQLVVTIT